MKGPDTQKVLRRSEWGRRFAAIATVILLGSVVGLFFRGENTRHIFTRSACAQDPNGAACQKVKRESDEAQSTEDACVSFRKVDRANKLLPLTKCSRRPRPETTRRGSIEKPLHGSNQKPSSGPPRQERQPVPSPEPGSPEPSPGSPPSSGRGGHPSPSPATNPTPNPTQPSPSPAPSTPSPLPTPPPVEVPKTPQLPAPPVLPEVKVEVCLESVLGKCVRVGLAE